MKRLNVWLFAAALTLMPLVGFSQAPQSIDVPYIEVVGESSATLVPNKIEVRITLSEEPSKGRVKLSELERNLSKAIKAAGFDLKDDLSVVSQSSKSVKRKDSYQYKIYNITVKDNEELSALFSALEKYEAGEAAVTRVMNDSTEAVRAKLRKQAMRRALKTAQTLAGAVDQEVGMAIKITDYSGGGDAVSYANYPVMLRSGSRMADESIPAIAESVDMKPITLSQSVTVRFQLLAPTPKAE